MPRLERFDTNNSEQKHKSIIHAFEKGRALARAQETGELNIIIGTSKRGVNHIGVVVDRNGRNLHMVNAVSDSKISLYDAAKTPEYPDIIISDKSFGLETILKKFSEYLFLKLNLQDIKINAYKNAKAYRSNNPIGTLDPKLGIVNIAA